MTEEALSRNAVGKWATRVRQGRAVVAIELRKILGGRRALPVVLLTTLPVVVVFLIAIDSPQQSAALARKVFADVYAIVILGATVFFGCALVFTNLFRGEILRRSLHFYLLAPLRRDVLTISKYIAGLLATWALFGIVTILVYVLFLGIANMGMDGTSAIAPTEMFNYLGITVLGCLAYGALFLLFGTLFRNPILPVAALLAWELLNFLLPAAPKLASVGFHLKALLPVQSVHDGPFAVLAELPSTGTAVSTLLAVSLLAVILACWRVQRMEIRYAED